LKEETEKCTEIAHDKRVRITKRFAEGKRKRKIVQNIVTILNASRVKEIVTEKKNIMLFIMSVEL
jgi:hypothetical protein